MVKALYKEIADVFAPEKFVHVGGDEVPKDCWTSNPQITAWMKDHPEVEDFAGLETLCVIAFSSLCQNRFYNLFPLSRRERARARESARERRCEGRGLLMAV